MAGFAPFDELVIDVEGWGARNIDASGNAHIEANFLGDTFASDVRSELLEVAFAVGDVDEVFFEEFGALRRGGVFPFGLFGKEFVGVWFPVVLESGGFGGRSGGGAVLVIREEEATVDDGEFAVRFFDGFVDSRID